MYKRSAQLKLRFETSRGSLSVEQLWDLSMSQLSMLVKHLKGQLKEENDDDLAFLEENAPRVDERVQLGFDIAKDIYLTKKAEVEAAKTVAETKAHNQKILEIIKRKQDSRLEEMSLEELEKMIK